MSFSFGFYNALNHDRLYDAIQVSEIFDGLIRDGVYSTIGDHYVVKASENENEVIVGSGRAWFDHTWNKNDADLPIAAPLPDLLMKRYDALVIDINANVASRTNQITWVEGVPSLNTPVKPTLTNTIDHHQYPLCYILRTANNNTIIQDNIENTIGTDECPFVTGILQQVSISDLLLQWTSQFATFMNTHEATASTWENEWEASMTQWTVDQKNAFATWMAGEKTEFDDWFANLHYILDGDVAGHLQNEIDAIEEGLGGSVFTIHTINSSLYGKTVTCTGSTQEKTAVFDASGNAEIKGITDVGTITFTATDGSQTATTQISVPYFSNYPITMAFWAATVNLSTTSEDLKGKTITIRKGGAVIASTSFNSAGTATYIATSAGTYTFTCQGYSVEQAITEETTYNVSINSGLSLSAWITAGSTTDYPLNPSSYANFAALEADEEAIRQLMLVHNAVDYLATAGVDDALIEDVINSDICAKWISLSDYAMDTLEANTNIRSVMDEADKYGYGEWVENNGTWGALGNVPIMTANNAPYGTASASSVYSSTYDAYKAFNGNDSDGWTAANASLTAVGNWVAYEFVNPINVKKVHVLMNTDQSSVITCKFKIQAYDGSQWKDLCDEILAKLSHDIDCDDEGYYTKFRLYFTTAQGNTGGYFYIVQSLQFYGRELTPLVPTMTSNTTPKGEASASRVLNGYPAWWAFDRLRSVGSTEKCWIAGAGVSNDYLRYHFAEPTVCKMAMIGNYRNTGNNVNSFEIQGSNNGTDFSNVLFSGNNPSTASATTYYVCNNNTVYSYLQILCKSIHDASTNLSIDELQFYGMDYSEKEFATGSTRKTIYDHGVILNNTFDIRNFNESYKNIGEKRDYEIYMKSTQSNANPPNYYGRISAGAEEDLTNYSGVYIRTGMESYMDSQGGLLITTASTGGTEASVTVTNKKEASLDITSFNTTRWIIVMIGTTGNYYSFNELWLE